MVLQREVAKLSVVCEDLQQEVANLKSTQDAVTPTLVDLQEKLSSSAKAIKLCLTVTEQTESHQSTVQTRLLSLQQRLDDQDARCSSRQSELEHRQEDERRLRAQVEEQISAVSRSVPLVRG